VQSDKLMGHCGQTETAPSPLLTSVSGAKRPDTTNQNLLLVFYFFLSIAISLCRNLTFPLAADLLSQLCYVTFKAIENTVVKLHFTYIAL